MWSSHALFPSTVSPPVQFSQRGHFPLGHTDDDDSEEQEEGEGHKQCAVVSRSR